jgi:rRNA maturation endonuclease Nob1
VSREVYVLDTSAVIAGLVPGIFEAKQVTVQEVLDEAKDFCSKLELETALDAGKISVMEPSKEALAEIEKKIGQTGDRVSKTDVKLLALSLDILRAGDVPKLVTDDYAIQNLASIFKIPFKRVIMPGITEIFTWHMVCPACGRIYSAPLTKCEVCGSELIRRPKK